MAPGAGLTPVGRLTDANNIFVDVGIGYWAYRNDASRGLTGIVPTVEIHQNTALKSGDIVTRGSFQIGDFTRDSSLTNIAVGATFEFGRNAQLTAAYVGPLGGGSDRSFDGGVQVYFNRFFGP